MDRREMRTRVLHCPSLCECRQIALRDGVLERGRRQRLLSLHFNLFPQSNTPTRASSVRPNAAITSTGL
jgi:hypothetical protein